MSFFKKLFGKTPPPPAAASAPAPLAAMPTPPLGGAGGGAIPQPHVPRKPLDVDAKLVYVEPGHIKIGNFYFVRSNVENQKGKQEITDLYIQVKTITSNYIVGKLLKFREYVKAMDLRSDLHIVADVNEDTGEIIDFQVLDSENREIAVNKEDYRDTIIDKEDHYKFYLSDLQDEYEETGGEDAEMEKEIAERKDEWFSADFVRTKDGAPLPGKWRDYDKETETDIPIKYIGDFPVYGYKFYKPRDGGRRRKRTFCKKRNYRSKTRSRK